MLQKYGHTIAIIISIVIIVVVIIVIVVMAGRGGYRRECHLEYEQDDTLQGVTDAGELSMVGDGGRGFPHKRNDSW